MTIFKQVSWTHPSPICNRLVKCPKLMSLVESVSNTRSMFWSCHWLGKSSYKCRTYNWLIILNWDRRKCFNIKKWHTLSLKLGFFFRSNPKSAIRKTGMTASCPEREVKVGAERELVKEIEMRERKKDRKRKKDTERKSGCGCRANASLSLSMQREGGINPVSYIKRNTIHVKERWDALKWMITDSLKITAA